MSSHRRRLVFAFVAALTGCKDEPPACKTVDLDCGPLYVPTFHNIYEMTLKDNCGSDKNACHSRVGRKGGMSFETEQSAYDALLVAPRVVPGDPECSEMIVRTSSPGADYQMPPGDALPKNEACVLIKWVQMGAMR
jgi:hypothetical protein